MYGRRTVMGLHPPTPPKRRLTPLRYVSLQVFFAIAAGALAGCYFTPNEAGGTGGGGGGGGGGGTSTTDGGTANMTGVPCDVAAALSACLGCHSSPPSGGAPMSLASYADLTAQSAQYPGQTEAQRAVARMSGNPTVMPPGGPAPASTDIATIQNWITAGYPQGSCGGAEAGANPYNTPVVCTSGQTSTVTEGQAMKPGEACIGCHSKYTGTETPPINAVMGTIYPTAHEPDDCVGASNTTYAGVTIVATDQPGHSVTVTPNSAGTFLGGYTSTFTSPYTVKITYQGRERDMTTPQTSGDCNSCHTESGVNGAPGRIMLP